MSIDVYGCILRATAPVLAIDVALLMRPMAVVTKDDFRIDPKSAFQLLRDLVESPLENQTALKNSGLARAIAGFIAAGSSDFAQVVAEAKITAHAHVPMGTGGWEKAYEKGMRFVYYPERKPPKGLAKTPERRWEQAFGALPRATYAIALTDPSLQSDLPIETRFIAH